MATASDKVEEIKPTDSISQTGSSSSSRTTSSSVARARAIAKEIDLAAKAAVLEKQKTLSKQQAELDKQVEREEYEARWRRREMDAQKAELEFKTQQEAIDIELQAARAITQVYTQMSDDGVVIDDKKSSENQNMFKHLPNSEPQHDFNPEAPYYRPSEAQHRLSA